MIKFIKNYFKVDKRYKGLPGNAVLLIEALVTTKAVELKKGA